MIVAGAVILTPRGKPVYGLWPVGLLLAFTALTALSVVWSVQPDDSWQDAGRMLAYSAVFGAAVVLARAAPARWPAVLGGVTLAAVVVCGYALLTKVFPAGLDAHDIYARLQAPYGYWNATGLTAAMGVIGCMWLGARRAGHALLSALAYPAMGLLLRDADARLLARRADRAGGRPGAVVLHRAAAPARRRRAADRRRSAPGWWWPGTSPGTRSAPTTSRCTHASSPGTSSASLLVAMLVVLTLAGLAIGFFTGRQRAFAREPRNAGRAAAEPPRARRDRLRGGARRQPPRPHRQHLPRLSLAHQPPRRRRLPTRPAA